MIKKSIFIIVAIISLAFFSACSNAKPEKIQPVIPAAQNPTESTAPVFAVGQYYDYIAKMKSGESYQLTIFVKENGIEGSLLLPQNDPQYLTGTYNDNSLALYAKGPQQATPPEFSGKLSVVDVLEGVFSASLAQIDNKPVKLTLSSMGYGTFGHRYDMIGTTEDATVDAFAKTIQKAVQSNDAKAFASMVSYPITVAVSGKSTQIKNADSLIKNYNNIMNDNLKKTLEKSLTAQLFCNSQGVMFGSGSLNLWITLVSEGNQMKLKVIGINNKIEQ